jgi:hypothetical protein
VKWLGDEGTIELWSILQITEYASKFTSYFNKADNSKGAENTII